jgi:TM2 domain-containing membrane protein YozV
MSKLLFLILSLSSVILSQDIHSPINRKIFADHLFCTGDYLRAVLEYEECLDYFSDDTVMYKIALGHFKIENYEEAAKRFQNINNQSEFYASSRIEFLKSKIYLEDFDYLNSFSPDTSNGSELKLFFLSTLLSGRTLLDKHEFLIPFEKEKKSKALDFYEWKKDPPYKSLVLAGILSTIVPGAGKIYTDQISEGLTAFVLNSLFVFLSYDNFKNKHNLRGWIFAGTGTLFYAGNIYGSVTSANIYNSRIDYEYREDVKSFLEEMNYFINEYDFCK